MPKKTLGWLLAGLALALPMTLTTKTARADDPLPSGESVLEKYIEATGGRDAYKKLHNRVASGKMTLSGAGISGTMTITQAEPNKMHAKVVLGELGTQVEATNGVEAWETSPFSGDRLLKDDEKKEFIQEAKFNNELEYKSLYSKVECKGVEDVNGKPAYKLELTPKLGKLKLEFYDKASGLLVKEVETKVNPMGEFTAEAYPSEYQKYDGILIPTKVTQKVLNQEIVITMTDVKHNVELPKDVFAIPDSVKKLIKEKP